MLNKINISPKKQNLIVYIFLTFVTLAVFWQVTQYDFVNFDDHVYVTQNSHIQSGITPEGFRWAFSTKDTGLWNPLTWLSFMFDYQLHGLNAGGYHLTNLILHIMSALLLFWLFNRMTGAIWRSAFVAALFALHPLHVESVAWIAERKDVLSAFFWMLTLCLYVYYTEKPVIKRYLPVLLCFACALMSKPMVVTLPVIMILLDYWPLGRLQSREIRLNLTDIMPVSTNQGRKKIKSKKGALKKTISLSHDRKLSETKIAGIIPLWQLREKIPFFIMSAMLVIITFNAPDSPFVGKRFSLSSRLANAPVSVMTYLGKTFWPHDMAIFYPFPEQLPLWQVLGTTLLIIVISAAVIVMVKRLPYLFVGWLWYAITLLPVIKIVQVGNDAMADRYHYLPSIGIAVMLAWGIPLLIKNENTRKKILFPAATAFIIILSVLTWQQCGYWKNSITLFSHAVQVTKNNYLAHFNLASALAEKENFYKAIYHYNEAIRIDSYCEINYRNRGNAYAKLDKHQLAIDDFNKAISLNPDYADAYFNRGTSYGKSGQYQLAISDFNKVISLKPDNIKAYNNRGIVQTQLGLYRKALDDFNEAIRLKPDYADAYNNRSNVYLNQGNNKLGCDDAQKACTLGNCKILEAVKVQGYCR
jgi:tetratricopeptide (TPR) repeat protein